MRIPAMLAASAHICLAACQAGPGSLLPPPLGGIASPLDIPPATKLAAPASKKSAPTPYMRCVTDFWGKCTGVVSSRHAYRWRYVQPGARSRERRESATARQAAPARDNDNDGLHKTVSLRASAPTRETRTTISDTKVICHARRRVVGDERPSRDDARRAAENNWMGAIRYDYGERYQDINRAKDVRQICNLSSTAAILKTPHYRCAVEATPCRAATGTKIEPKPKVEPKEPKQRREEPPKEELISRK